MTRSAEIKHWHGHDPAHVVLQLRTDRERGLDAGVAEARLARHGPNDIEVEEQRSLAAIVGAQFADFMILVLLAAAVISGILGEAGDAVAIIVIVALNAIVGATQEFRAQRAIKALRRMSAPEARVIRSGSSITVPAAELVPGDIVKLEAGNVVPADLRLLEAHGLSADESALTGESIPVEKHVATLDDADLPLGDRRNMAFKSTSVTKERAIGVVVATGFASEIGRIAGLLAR
jgi:Ca2+-transporting ATPase